MIDKELAHWFLAADVENSKRTTISTKDDSDFDAVLFPFHQYPDTYPGYNAIKKSLRDRGIDESKERVLSQWFRIRGSYQELFEKLAKDRWAPEFLKIKDETTEALRGEHDGGQSDYP